MIEAKGIGSDVKGLMEVQATGGSWPEPGCVLLNLGGALVRGVHLCWMEQSHPWAPAVWALRGPRVQVGGIAPTWLEPKTWGR